MNDTDALIEELGTYAYDPVGFVYWAFPWGEAGTELAKAKGPEEWQLAILRDIRDKIITPEQAILEAVTSGHGVGKSALVSWIVWWAFSTFKGTRGVVTANTENQLKTKTWVEITKWHRLFIARHLFKATATALFAADEESAREWRIDIVPWSEKNVEAFAGLHNAGKRLLVIFDEASAIPDVIWETTEGALTDKGTEILWCVFGNPTKNTGRFRECFEGGRFAHRWHQLKVDSRSVSLTNKDQINQWIEDYGIDSDFVKVRVLGEFPSGAIDSFIGPDVVQEAIRRVVKAEGPVVLGVDVARFGDDFSVIWPRRGRDASSLPIRAFQGLSITDLTEQIVNAYNEYQATAVFIDSGGVGGGVVDQCRALGLNVVEVTFGARLKSGAGERYLNKRAKIWGDMREWLKTGSIPARAMGRDFLKEFTSTLYQINEATGRIQLESKAMMRRRGEPSPDFADALACTFALPSASVNIAPRFLLSSNTDYNPFNEVHYA